MNKTDFHGESIGVAPSRFSLITVAQAPTTEDHVVAKSAGTKVDEKKTKDTVHQQHHQEVNKEATTTQQIQQDEMRSESAPPAKSAPLTK